MADLEPQGGGGKGGKKRSKKMSTRVDFTPMVDLAFLLITFFMLTTTFAKPQAMEINMPEKPKPGDEIPEVKESTVITLLLAKNDKVVYYFGIPKEGTTTATEVAGFGASGIRKVLLKKKAEVDAANPGKKNLTLALIKPMDDCNYRNFVDVIDEMAITGITRYAVVDAQPVEKDMVKAAGL